MKYLKSSFIFYSFIGVLKKGAFIFFNFTKKMLISGIQKTTLLDFPGKIACIIFTLGCNMKCGFCHNSDFVLPHFVKEKMNDLISERAFFNFLKSRVGILDGVVICGGEPTIHKDLPVFIKKIKDMGFFVKLDTNGANPELIKKLLSEKLLDYIAMDVKHSTGKISDISGVEIDEKKIEKSINIIKTSNISHEFRTTIIKGQHNLEDIKNIAKKLNGAKVYFLQNYRKGNNLDPNFKGSSFSDLELEEIKNNIGNNGVKIKLRA